MNVVYFHSRYESSANGHEFSLDCCDAYGLDLKLFNNRIVGPDVSSCCSNVGIFDATICNDSGAVGAYLRFSECTVKVLEILVQVLIR